ncbi:hypothetical protein ACS0TY_026932 [Phlomoides rotata]
MLSFNELMLFLNKFQIDQSKEDAWRWSHANDGNFSTKRAYEKLMSATDTEVNRDKRKAFKKLWRCQAPRSVQSIVWKVLKRRLPTKSSLQRKGIIQSNGNIKCVLCGEEEDDVSHVFIGSRNNCVFNGEVHNSTRTMYEIKTREWSWLVVKGKTREDAAFSD